MTVKKTYLLYIITLGGANALIDMAAFEINRAHSNIVFLFDGDCEPKEPVQDQSDIPSSEDGNLEEIIKKAFNHCPKIPCDSNQHAQKIKNFRTFLDYSKTRFRYFPFDFPEKFIVKNHDDLKSRSDTNDSKDCLKNYVQEQLGSSGVVQAGEILAIQRQLLSNISKDHADFRAIAEILRYFISLAPTAN